MPTESPKIRPAERSVHRAAQAERRGGSGRAALVVDASPVARAFLVQRLQGLGYEAHGTGDGDQALALVRQQRYAIVFVELVLERGTEGLDGLALCQQIKRRIEHPGGIAPAVVFTTGSSGATDQVRGSLAGCDAYLHKPLIEADFLAALREVDPLFG